MDREEFIEQAYFFRVFRERLEDSTPAQEILVGVRDEILTTTKLPLAIDFLVGELHVHGKIGHGMGRLKHYFMPFQTFIVQKAEDDESRLDFRLALKMLEHEAEFRANENMTPQALFIYQFECIARNRLGYMEGLDAITSDPTYDENWQKWFQHVNMNLGSIDFADLVYMRSEQHLQDVRHRTRDEAYQASYPILFDGQTGRIAKANHGKDPLYMFAALQRQLGFPAVPRPAPPRTKPLFEPHIEQRFHRLENRLTLLEQETKGELDLSKFYEGKKSPFGSDNDKS